MRLLPQHIDSIKQHTLGIFGPYAVVRLFGSRLDDAARGGDVDLHVDCPTALESPAAAIARLSVACSRAMSGRKVDVLLSAPGLQEQPIHRVARQEGVVL